jgi:hypothetical protein
MRSEASTKRFGHGTYIATQANRGAPNMMPEAHHNLTTGGAENPTLTIVALAIRQADFIADQMKSGTIRHSRKASQARLFPGR